MNNLIAIVPAAGIGKRAATPDDLPKQYRKIAGTPVLRLSVLALLADKRINKIVVAVAPNDNLADQALAGLDRVQILACGGASRADTVRNALAEINLSGNTWVLVHDAARPGLPATDLARLIDSCWQHNKGGLLALPVADTLKYACVSGDVNYSQRTVARDNLWQAQTPQMFLANDLIRALKQTIGHLSVTDEASAIELSGLDIANPLLVMGSRANFKLTYPEDFIWFDKYIFNSKNDK